MEEKLLDQCDMLLAAEVQDIGEALSPRAFADVAADVICAHVWKEKYRAGVARGLAKRHGWAAADLETLALELESIPE